MFIFQYSQQNKNFNQIPIKNFNYVICKPNCSAGQFIHPANSETPFNSLEKKCVRSRNSKSVAIFRRLLKESNLKIIRLFCRRSLLSVIYYGCQILTQTISFRDCDFKATFSGHVSRTNQGPPVLNNE